MPLKVCLLTGEYPPMQGGIADYTRELARWLRRRGVEVGVLTSRRAAPPPSDDAAAGVEVFPAIGDWGFGFWAVASRVLGEMGVDVVHIQYQPAAYSLHPAVNLLPWWLHWRHRPGPRVVTTFHDLRGPYIAPKAGPLRPWATRALVRGSDAAVFTNEDDRARTKNLNRRSFVIPLAHNIPLAPPAGFDRPVWRARLGVGPGEPLLGYFGFLNRSKGVDVLVEALRRLREREYTARLLIVGGSVGDADPTNVAYRAAVQQTIADHHLSESVIWTGHLTPAEVSAHLLAADLVALPYGDGASFRRTTLLAALAHGRAVVTTRPQYEPGRGPTLVDGENCRLVPAGDAEALAGAVAFLLDHPEERERLGRQGAALAATFSWEAVTAQTLQVYQEVFGKRRPLC